MGALINPVNEILPEGTDVDPDLTTCGFEVAKLNLTAFTGTVDLVAKMLKTAYSDSDSDEDKDIDEDKDDGDEDEKDQDEDAGKDAEEYVEEEDTNYRWFTMVVGEGDSKHRIIVDEWNQYDDGEFYAFEKTIRCAGTQEALAKFYESLPKKASHRDNNVEITRTYIQKFHLSGDLSETCEERDIRVIAVYNCTDFPDHYDQHDKVNNNDDKQNPEPDAEPL